MGEIQAVPTKKLIFVTQVQNIQEKKTKKTQTISAQVMKTKTIKQYTSDDGGTVSSLEEYLLMKSSEQDLYDKYEEPWIDSIGGTSNLGKNMYELVQSKASCDCLP